MKLDPVRLRVSSNNTLAR